MQVKCPDALPSQGEGSTQSPLLSFRFVSTIQKYMFCGGTITNTERRIRFSPEIPGPRIGESRSEWEIIRDLARHVLPAERQRFLAFQDAETIRQEMDRVLPLYKGIKNLTKEKDSFQYGGPMLLQDGICSNLPNGRARFSAVSPKNDVLESGQFYLATRRGKQFNSIVYGTTDPLIGSRRRDEIFMSPHDAQLWGFEDGDRILLKSQAGEFEGFCRLGDLQRGIVQAFWPEANVLISRRLDPESREPDYNTIVTITRME